MYVFQLMDEKKLLILGWFMAIIMSVYSKDTSIVNRPFKMDCDVATTLAPLREAYAPRNDEVRGGLLGSVTQQRGCRPATLIQL